MINIKLHQLFFGLNLGSQGCFKKTPIVALFMCAHLANMTKVSFLVKPNFYGGYN